MKIIKLFMIWITVAGFAASLHAQTTQQVTAIQYFYNTDPGVGIAGNGAIVSVTPADNIDQVFSFNVPATLGNGFHYLYVRAQDVLGRWSLIERRLFVIQSITATENITDYAYYFDTDPGVGNAGNGAIVPVTSTPNFSATVAITVPPSLTEGFHYLYVRTRDESGQWSLIERRLFVIQSITATENITDYAYYFDTDPGVGNPGNGAIVPVSPTANFSASVAITVPPSLTEGFHYLYVRTRDVSGQWSLIDRRLFVIQAITPAEDITALEWYIDTDPGVGNGNPYPVIPATGEVNATLDLGGVPCLSPGLHYLYVRAKNTAGRWSIIERLALTLNAGPEINVLGNAITIVDGDVTPVAADGTDFGQPLPSVPVIHTFIIQNSGTVPLNISSLSMSGAEASSFTIAGISTPLALAAAGSTTFTVSFAAAPVGNYNAMLNINSDDCDEAIYNFALQAEVSCQPAAFSACPANISVNNTANQCNAAVTYTATVTGDPAPVVSYTFTGVTTGSGSGTGSGSTFNKGITTVTINATNACGNVNCSFTVTVVDNQPPATPTLANVTVGECSGTPTAPTTTDNCAGTITGTTSTVFPITTQGTTVVTWTFNDGNGNSTTANQNVIVDDVTAPVTPTLANVTVGECSGTLVAPTTTDVCAGTITGTTSTVFPITTQGTTVVTWTFNDGNGNSTTANQNVIVDDVTAPVTPTLANVTVGECSGTPVAPTTTDVCAGTITGTTTTVFPITTQGTTVVTWTFNDGNGNSTTANQNVIINDVTNPVITCPANTFVQYGNDESPAANGTATATDNCAGVSVGTPSDVTVNGPGNNKTITRTWTATDVANNTATCNQTITVCDLSVSLGNDKFVFFGIPGQPGTTAVITATISGGLTGVTYLWSSTNISVNGLTTQSVTPTGYLDGQAIVYTVTATAPNGCTATSSVTITYFNINCSTNGNTVKVKVCHIPQGNPTNCNTICVSINAYQTLLNNGSYLGQCLPNCAAPPARGIPDVSNYIVGKQTLDVKVFNNPSHTFFGLYVFGDFYQKVSLRVMDMYGRVVDQKNNLNTEQEIIIGESYISGVYMVEVMQGKNRKVVKLVKQ